MTEEFNHCGGFEILRPEAQTTPFIFGSPHSGRHYPLSFLQASRLDAHTIRRSEDAYVDELIIGVRSLGAPLIRAHFPRAYLDLNREPYELDPGMFSEPLPAYANSRSLRVAGGLGTIARIVGNRQEIYPGPMPLSEALRRIDTLYKPYHAALRRLMATTFVDFGTAVLVDCHSMPSSVRMSPNEPQPDIVIGDRHGGSCNSILTHRLAAALRDLGYVVSRNKPYAGGFITEHYGRPMRGLHALQIEISRGLYLDEKKLVKRPNFQALAEDLTSAFQTLMSVETASLIPASAANVTAAAAE